MNLFEEIDEDLFRPLTGINKRKYIDLLALVRDKCKRMPMYAIEKSTVFDMAKAGDCSSAFCYVMRATISEARQGRCIAPRRGILSYPEYGYQEERKFGVRRPG